MTSPSYACLLVLAAVAHALPIPDPAASAVPVPPIDYSISLVELVESFQPDDPYLPNRWSQAMRAAYLYGGALRVFTAQSEVVTRYLEFEGPSRQQRAPTDVMLAPLGELPSDVPPALAAELLAEARRLLSLLEREDILFHLDQLSEPCRLVAPPPYRDENSPLLSQETFELGAFKNLAIVCAARMRLQAGDGEHLRAMKSFAAGMRLGRAACGRPMLLSLFSGQAIQNRMLLNAIELARAAHPPLDTQTLDQFDRIVDRLPLPTPDTFINMERLIGYDAIDRYYSKIESEEAAARQAAAATSPPTDAPPEPAPVQRLTSAEARAVLDRALDKCIDYLHHEVPAVDRSPEAPVDLPLGPAGDPRLVDLPPGRVDPDGLVRNLLPPVGQMVVGELEHRAFRAAGRAAVLLERYRAAQGSYPADLDVMNGELAALAKRNDDSNPTTQPPAVHWPGDPCAPDRPLAYRKVDQSYMLYSVGADGHDDHAAPAPRARNAFIPGPRGQGTDFIIVPAPAP